MSANEMTAKVRELKELKAMAEELAQEITAIEDANPPQEKLSYKRLGFPYALGHIWLKCKLCSFVC